MCMKTMCYTFYKNYQSNYNWWNVRLVAILMSTIPFLDLEILFLMQSLLLIHLILGLKNTFQDYTHNLLLKSNYIMMWRLMMIEFVSSSMEILM